MAEHAPQGRPSRPRRPAPREAQAARQTAFSFEREPEATSTLPPSPTVPRARTLDPAAQPGVTTDSPSGRTLDPTALRRLRAALHGRTELEVVVHDNRRTMLSMQQRGGRRVLRLHHMFSDAPAGILEAIGRYLARGDRLASKLIDRYIADNQGRIRERSPVGAGDRALRTRGAVHDLAEIQRELSERYFSGALSLAITWGRARPRTRARTRDGRRTMRLGTYLVEEKLVRIHPALDQGWVPRFFVAWVVYHEMLHHVVPIPVVAGRKVYHSEEFRSRERLFDEYALARVWERENVRKLLRPARKG